MRPFKDAAHVPADVHLYVHVEKASDLRRQLRGRPIAEWMETLAAQGDLGVAAGALAANASMDKGALFDLLLGDSFTLIAGESGEWALQTTIAEHRVMKLLQALRPRVHQPRGDMAISELPEQQVLIACNGSDVFVGPRGRRELFDRMMDGRAVSDRAEAGDGARPAMLDDIEGFERARDLGSGRVEVFVRHDGLMGGWSAIVADLQGDDVTIRHAATFEHAPFSRGVTRLSCDFSPALAFQRHALAAFVQPTDIGDGPVETFVAAALDESLISADMRRNLGDRRLTVIGELEGRQLENPVDILSTTFVTCLEVRNREPALEQIDRQMSRLTARLNDMAHGAFLLEGPDTRRMRACDIRETNMSDAAEWFGGGFPIMKNVSLAWTVTSGPSGSWFVVGSHRRSVDDVVKTLQAPGEQCKLMNGRFDSCGVGNGVRIGRHLASWGDRAADFADEANVNEFRQSIGLMSQLASGLESCRWQLARPSVNEMRLDVQVKLTKRESADQPN